MTEQARIFLVANGIRWCSNILIELLSNHGKLLSDKCRDDLKEAVSHLEGAQFLIGKQ